jgi:hypothetical protein
VLLPEVREGLSARRNGLEYMTQSLAKRYDYLADVVTPPPVGPIAFALAAMDEKRTAPVLVEYLLDPQTTTDDLKHTALALSKLAGPEQLEGLVTFTALNRCTANDDELIQAMAAVARTILRIEGEKGNTRLVAWAADPLTTSAVREMLGGLTRTGMNRSPSK